MNENWLGDFERSCNLLFLISNAMLLGASAWPFTRTLFKALTPMPRYSAKFMEHINSPRNAGWLEAPDGIGNASLDGQAPRMTMYVIMDNGNIKRATFTTFGCGAAIAACSALTEMATGLRVEECYRLTDERVIDALGGVPPEKKFCVGLALAALRDALERSGYVPRIVDAPE
jgi:nitrogen fixation NifU-like protein